MGGNLESGVTGDSEGSQALSSYSLNDVRCGGNVVGKYPKDVIRELGETESGDSKEQLGFGSVPNSKPADTDGVCSTKFAKSINRAEGLFGVSGEDEGKLWSAKQGERDIARMNLRLNSAQRSSLSW